MPHSPKLPGHALAWLSLTFAGQLAAQAPYPCTWAGGNGGDWVSPQWAPQPLDFIKESGIPIPLITWPDNNRAVGSGTFVYVPTIGDGRVNLNSTITVSAVGVNSGAEIRIRGGTLRLEGYSGYSGAAAANDGLISLGNNATLTAASAIFLPSGLTIDGGGTVSLLDEASAIKGNFIDFGSSQLVRGAGQIGVAFGTIGETPSSVVNRGTVLADAPPLAMTIQGTDYENKGTTRALGGGLLKFRSLATDNQQLVEAQTGVADFQDFAVENSGTLRATAGGILQFKNQTVSNAGGLIEAVGIGSLVQLRGDVTLESGILRRTNRTTVTLQTGTNTFTGGLLVQGRIEIEPTAGLRLRDLVLTGEAGTILNPQPGAVIFSDAPVDLRGRFDGNGLWTFNAPLSLTGPLTLNALQFDVGAGQPVNVSGTVTNNSVIRLLDAAGAPDTRLVAVDGSVFDGSGQVRFATAQTNRVTPAAPGAVLTNAAPHLFTTEVGGSAIFTATFVNASTTEAAGAGSVVQFQNPTLTNTGLLQARDGGSLRFNSLTSGGTTGYVITNTGGTLRFGAGSSGSFEQNVLLRGGTIDGAGTLNTTGTTVFDSLPANPIVITDATVVLNEFQPFTLRGNLTNSGTIYLNDGTLIAPGGQQGSAALTLDGDVTIGGSGQVIFGTEYANLINAIGATTPTLTLGPAQTVTNLPGARGLIYPPFVNQGLIEAVGPNPTGFPNIELLSPAVTNTGIIGVRDNGVLFFNANNLTMQNTGGTLRANSGGYIDFRGSPTVVGGQFAGSGVFLASNLTLDSATSPITLNAVIAVAPGQLRLRGPITNNSVIQLAHPTAGGSNIVIDAAVGASLLGPGRLNFGSAANNSVIDGPGTNPVGLTNGPGHTITNTPGHLGLINPAVFVNQGLVEAVGPNPPSQPNLTLNSGSLTNNGVIASRDTGVLFLNSLNVQNAGGFLRVAGGATFQLNNGAVVHGGTLDGTGTFSVTGLTLNGTATAVTHAARMSIGGYSNLTLRGSVTNLGDVLLFGVVGPGSSAAQVSIHGPVTLGGTGRIVYSNNSRNQIIDLPGTSALLTLSAGQTITTVPGANGTFTASVLNLGTIESRGTGTVLEFAPTALTNQGVIQTADGGYLNFNLVAVANAGGFLRVGAGSTFQLSNNAVISGGTLDGTGAFAVGLITLDGSVSPLTNATTLSMAPGQANLRGSILNQGTLAVGTGGIIRATSDGFTLGGSGALRFTGANGNLSSHGTGVFAPMTLASGATVTTAPGATGIVTGLDLTNQGVIEARGSGALLNFGPNTLLNSGVVQSADGGSLNLTVLNVANAGGTLRVASGSAFALANSVVINGGILEGTGTFGISLATLDGSATAVTVGNTLSLVAGSTLQLRGSIVNHGLISVNAATNGATVQIAPQGATLSGSGVLRLGGPAPNYLRAPSGSPAFTLAAGATVTSTPGSNAFIDTVAFTNQGTVEARGAGANVTFNCNATNQGLLGAADGGTLTISGANNLILENGTGIIRAEAGSLIPLVGSIQIRGGRLEGAGAIRSQQATLNGSTQAIVNAGNLQVGAGGLTLQGTLQNDADVRHVSAGQTLRVLGPVTLSGTGTYTFGTPTYAFIQGFAAGDVLTVAAGQTMTTAAGSQGRLQGFALLNQGVVEARGASAILDVFTERGLTNSNLLRAAAGGTLNLGAGPGTYTVENAAGTLRNEGGALVVNALVRGGRVESTVGSEVRSTGAIFEGLANAVEITAGSTLRAANLTLRGTFQNAGNIYSSNAGQSTVRIEGPVSLDGPGTMTFGPSQYTFLQGAAAADVLTLANGHTLTTQPGGLARAQGLTILSSGVLEARGANSVFDLWPERGFTNNGLVRAAAGGTMNVGAGLQYVVENAGGSIRNEGGAVILNAILRGGRFESGPGLEVRSTGAILDGVANPIEITAGSTLRAAGLTLRGNVTNAGNILSANTGQSTIRIEGPVHLSGPGALTFGPTQYTFLQGQVAGDALTLAGGQTMTTQPGGQVRIQNLPLTSSGIIEARGAGTRFDYYSTASTNLGLIRTVDSGLLYLGQGAGSVVENAGGIVRNESGSFILNARIRGGRVESFPASGGFYVEGTGTLFDGSSSPLEIAAGALVYTVNGQFAVQGEVVNNGTLGLFRSSGGAVLHLPQTMTLGGTGEVVFGSAFNNNLQSAGGVTFTNGATHTVRCTAGSTGVVAVSHYVNAGQTVVDGTLTFNTTSHTNGPTGVLSGNGSIVTSPVLANQGKISPGSSAGALLISGSVTNTASAVFEAELGGTVSGTEFDRLSVSGSFARGGELRPVLINGFRPAPTDSFLVLSAGSLSGAWANVVSGKVTFLQGSFDVVQTATTVTLTNFQRNAAYAAYDAWVAGYPGLTGAAKEPGADPDGDGVTNLQEFAFGLDPTKAGGALGLPRAFLDPVSGRLRIEFPRRKQTPPNFLSYELQYSSDLTGPWSIHPSGPVETVDLDAVFELVTFEDLNGPPNYLQRFGRVRVELGP